MLLRALIKSAGIAGYGFGADNITSADLFYKIENQNVPSAFKMEPRPEVIVSKIFRLNPTIDLESQYRLSILLENDLAVQFLGEQTQLTTSGSRIWEGILSANGSRDDNADPTQNSAILVEREGAITGSVRFQGQLYHIKPAGNGYHRVEKVDENRMPPDHPADFDLMQTSSVPLDLISNMQASEDSVPVIKMLVPYTAQAKNNVSDIYAFIDLAFAESNAGLRNSNINATLELAYAYEVDYQESSSIHTDLARLRTPGDGYMEDVHDRRDEFNADLVMMLGDFTGACGVASTIAANEETAFAVTDWSCATGYYTFGHEIGHLIGTRHNPETDGSSYPFPYGHGYWEPSSLWRTVMAYNCTNGCPRINYWSNPEVFYQGRAMGTHELHNNARVWNERAPIVAAFRGDDSGGTGNKAPQAIITPSANSVTGPGTIQLSGEKSYDPDGDTLSYQWQQISPIVPKAVIASPASVSTEVRFNSVDATTQYRFRLTVSDSKLTSTADVVIEQRPKNSGGNQCTPKDPDAVNYPEWSRSQTYIGGDRVSYQDLVWEAKWWISGSTPDSSDAWKLISNVILPWQSGKGYNGGEQVIFDGRIYEAKYWSKSSPATSPSSWIDKGEYKCELQ